MERSKLYKLLGIIVGAILLIILIIVVFILIAGGGPTYSYVETTIKDATEKYYTDHPDLLPSPGERTSVDVSTLAAEGYIEPMDKLVKKDTCTGTGKVFNTGVDYIYSSSLDCGDIYVSMSAFDYLKSKQEIKADGSGLYEETLAYPIINESEKESDFVYNTSLGTTTRWVYRGKNPNNHLTIGRFKYYIHSFSEQDIKVVLDYYNNSIFDDRYNESTNDYAGKNVYNTSALINSGNAVFADLPEDTRALVIPQIVCIGDRKADDFARDGSSECKRVLVKQNYSVLAAYETILPSTDENCNTNIKSCGNNNYLAESISSWTTTPEAGSTTSAFVINRQGLYPQNVNWTYNFALVISINPNVKLSGEGTEDNPFVVED